MTIHHDPHPLAGQTVRLADTVTDPHRGLVIAGSTYHLEDWWDRIAGKSWMDCDGNPAAMMYGWRAGLASLPTDNEVVYGKIDGLGHLVHVSELPGGGPA